MKYVFLDKTPVMKKYILLLLLPVLCLSLKAQNTYTDMPGRWRLGFNMGAIWETSDVSPIPGLGGGFNIEKILNKHVSPIGFSLGFRYLGGRTYGLNGNASFDIKDNTALNGTGDQGVRYDSLPGYFYANHKTFIQEGALELKMNFPRFEQRTHIIFHIWGGIGIGKFKTWIDAKDAKGNMYDFTALGGKTVAQSEISKVYDGSYETLADGSGRNGTIRPIPSFGAGLGFRLSPSVAFVIEHKVSLPLTDKLDGFTYAGACPNDFYHYTSANLIFTFGTKSKTSGNSSTHTDNTVYTNNTNTTNTQTVTPNNATNTATTNTVPATPKVLYPPTVKITYPSNNYLSQYDNVSVSAQLQNITSSQQISIMLNGYPLTHFSFNPSNGMLNFQSFLALGNNYFTVTGTNNDGSASDNVNVVYNPQFNAGGNIINNGTTVVTTNTVTTTNTNTVATTVTPTVTTINGDNPTGTVTVHTNTTTANNTTTVTPTGTVTTVTPTGTVGIHTNTVTTTGTPTVSTGTVGTGIHTSTVNPTGTGTVSTIHTGTTSPTTGTGTLTANGIGQAPVIQIYNPSENPYDEVNSFYNVSASVLNITSASQLSISVNNQPITLFTYSTHNKMLGFNVQLAEGKNTVVINATNQYGSDSKSTIISHRLGKPPKVLITLPASSPFTTLNTGAHIAGFVYNVKAATDIQVTAAGSMVSFNYNPADNSVAVNLTLQAETTQVVIKGTNQFGTDQQAVDLIYKKVNGPGVTINTDSLKNQNGMSGTGGGIVHGNGPGNGGGHSKPEITVLTPVSDPFYTNNSSVSVTANINMVLNASDVSVSCNGAVVPASYDVYSKKLVFNAPLKPGMNTFVINASNMYGSSSKQVNVSYTPVNTNLNSNPGNNNTGKPNINIPNNNGNNNNGNNNGGMPKVNTNPGRTVTPGTNNSNQTNPNNGQSPKPSLNPGNTQPAPRTVAPSGTQPSNNGGGR